MKTVEKLKREARILLDRVEDLNKEIYSLSVALGDLAEDCREFDEASSGSDKVDVLAAALDNVAGEIENLPSIDAGPREALRKWSK